MAPGLPGALHFGAVLHFGPPVQPCRRKQGPRDQGPEAGAKNRGTTGWSGPGSFAPHVSQPAVAHRFGSDDHGCLLAFGQLTFCNHSDHPNATIRWREDDIGPWAELEALQSIAAGEEITLFYTNISEYSAGDLFI